MNAVEDSVLPLGKVTSIFQSLVALAVVTLGSGVVSPVYTIPSSSHIEVA